eukprot:Skav218816  [mRNA]  locus=scaffold1140:497065:501587:+ [translate_table: standard]
MEQFRPQRMQLKVGQSGARAYEASIARKSPGPGFPLHLLGSFPNTMDTNTPPPVQQVKRGWKFVLSPPSQLPLAWRHWNEAARPQTFDFVSSQQLHCGVDVALRSQLESCHLMPLL